LSDYFLHHQSHKLCIHGTEDPSQSVYALRPQTVHQQRNSTSETVSHGRSIPSVVLYHMRYFDYVFALFVLLTGLKRMLLAHTHTAVNMGVDSAVWRNSVVWICTEEL